MNTIVTAFVSNVNNKYDNSMTRYYNYGKLLLKSTVPKVLFLDEYMFQLIETDPNYAATNTLLIKINNQSSYLSNYTKYLTKFELNSTDNTKDTLNYILTICNKTEWVNEAILLNHFKTDYFIWLDFGIRHVFKCSDQEFIEKINNLQYKIYDKVKIGNIWNLNFNYNIDIYKDIAWYFAGGFFGGKKESLTYFSNLVKEKCIETILIKNSLMWEVNIWYLVYIYKPSLFDSYYCDHNDSIIDNY